MPHLPTRSALAARIDHANLKPTATDDDLQRNCDIARRRGCASLCVRPFEVGRAANLLAGSGVAVGTVVAFPHGSAHSCAKAEEGLIAREQGAEEIDMVLNIGKLIEGDLDYVTRDIAAVADATGDCPLKVILECCFLTPEQIVAGCRAAEQAGANYVKTSTGFGEYGARVEDVTLLRRSVPGFMKVKAAGGIRTLDDALAMIAAGADRLGTSSTEAILSALPQ
ncbi:MAG: deoxyribose-phosphate aldolase [Phycisphaerae bacterium]